MNEVITIGIDLAKSVFQLHGVDGGAFLGCAVNSDAARCSSSFSVSRRA